jgi:hypothetical protein
MHFVNIFTGKLLSAKERRGAPQSSHDVAYWHFSDMPTASGNVSFEGKNRHAENEPP